jgi:radical SAM superfamily enzyme YgiQ (UPF0313 family)
LANRESKLRLNLFLVRPSNYDDDGYVVRYFRGILPSNTLACLAALTHDAAKTGSLSAVELRMELIDETVTRVDCARIARTRKAGARTVVCLAGVQSNQFTRAADLARELRRSGVTVLIGGFHVSGYLNMSAAVPPEIQELLDLGVTIVKGEVEGHWAGILEDAVRGRLRALYDFADDKPDLSQAPVPAVQPSYLKRFVWSKFGTIDLGRGCPFNCSYCTIINVQGRKMRYRDPGLVVSAIRENHRRHDVGYYFFTDDNFARNPKWEETFDLLAQLREKEGLPIEFMMQVDVLSYKIPRFVEKAARAGCTQAFIGMESLNPANLAAVGKRQNHVEEYRDLIDAYRTGGVACHVGYMLGFPFDTPDSVRADLRRLTEEVRPDQASFFMLTPLPGSRDHQRLVQEGVPLDPDFNNYDSCHETMPYAGFPEKGSLCATAREAWETFYSVENMRRILERSSGRNYWNALRNFVWYKSATVIDRRHPMMSGFVRLKGRRELRPSLTPLGRWEYARTRVRELRSAFAATGGLLLEMQFLWLETRPHSEVEKRIRQELAQLRAGARRRLTWAELKVAYLRARAKSASLPVPSRLSLWAQKYNPLRLSSQFYWREEIVAFWRDTFSKARTGRFYRIQLLEVIKRSWLDFKLAVHFTHAWITAPD